jgi:hypothetical protein
MAGRSEDSGDRREDGRRRRVQGRGGGWEENRAWANEVTPHPIALRRNSRATQGPALAGVKTGYSRPTGYFRTKSGNSRPRSPKTGILKDEILGMQVRETTMLGFR